MEPNQQFRNLRKEPSDRSDVDANATTLRPPRVGILASDPFTCEGVTQYLRAEPQVEVLSVGEHPKADVTVMLADEVTTATLAAIRKASLESVKPEMRIILVANGVSEAQLTGAIKHRVVSFLPRQQTEMRHILSAVLNAWAGRAHLPSAMIRTLIENLRVLQSSESQQIGLTGREIDIVVLLAEGWTTAEIAEKLSYSERTIKNCLHGLLARLDLRSRAHAVGYAARLGVI